MVTSNLASAVAIGIAAITAAVAAGMLLTGWEGATPKGEGRTAASLLSPPLVATRCRLSLHSSRKGGGAMLNPVYRWPLSNKYRSVALKKLNFEIKSNIGTYLDERGRALKPRPAGDEPAEQGSLTGHDPHPLTSTEGGADPAGSRLAHESP